MRKSIKKVSVLVAVLMIGVSNLLAQSTKYSDKDIYGTWMCIGKQYDGENRKDWGKANGFTSFKYYGADGEYCCALISRQENGKIFVSPHEYGTYTYKDGWYSEMGRSKTKTGIIFTDKDHFHGRWLNSTDYWKRIKISKSTLKYILELSKLRDVPEEVQMDIDEIMFK